MTKRSDSENGNGVPGYLASLRDMAGRVDRLLVHWKETHPYLRELLLDRLPQVPDNGITLTLSSSPHDMHVCLRTTRYGYEARYQGDSLDSILETIDNDLSAGTVPWREDWRRRRENNKRLDIV